MSHLLSSYLASSLLDKVLHIQTFHLLAMMVDIADAPGSSESKFVLPVPEFEWFFAAVYEEDITVLREQYKCSYFPILVIGRANVGKTTILEKVCGVAKGTHPIVICNKEGKLDDSTMYFLIFCSF